MAIPLIETRKLNKVYRDDLVETPALKDIDLSIDKGEFVAIMGPSGSGKSTLLHVLGFLDKYEEGEYLFEGKNTKEYSENELADIRNDKVGFIFQAFNLLPRTSVLENVKLPLLYSSVPKSKWEDIALEAIDAVGLSHRQDHEPAQLSGGEKQRVAIARALVNNPKVIFADEPTGNLDSKSGKIIMEILQRLNEDEKRTIILVTHETYTAEHAQRIIHILDGEIDKDYEVKKIRKASEDFEK